MKKIIFILLALVALLQVNAQKEETETVFAPIGAKWYYKIQLSNFAPDWYYRTFEAIKDTIIEGKKCVVLEQMEHYGSEPYITGYEYLYTKEQKVYHWNKLDKEFFLLYDFSANVGETWQIPCACDENGVVTMRVEEVSYVDYSGLKLKSFKIVSESLFSFGNITERLGGSGYLFLYGYAYDDMYIPQFYCYSDNETATPCNVALGISYTEEQTTLTVIGDYIQLPTSLQLKTNEVLFYGMDGKIALLKKIDKNQRISVSDLSAGIFILSIETKNEGNIIFKVRKL